MFLSINRYERKKNLMLAVEAFSLLRQQLDDEKAAQVHLIVAGRPWHVLFFCVFLSFSFTSVSLCMFFFLFFSLSLCQLSLGSLCSILRLFACASVLALPLFPSLGQADMIHAKDKTSSTTRSLSHTASGQVSVVYVHDWS